jgi:hypothetical protein
MDGSSLPSVRAALVNGVGNGATAADCAAGARLGDGERLRLSPTAAVRGGLLLLLLLRLILCCLFGLFFLGGICFCFIVSEWNHKITNPARIQAKISGSRQ